jgi:serpin B
MRRATLLLGSVLLVAAAGWYALVYSPPRWTGDMQTAADANNRFALDLYAQLRGEPGNLFLSPYGAHAALAMTATGARGATRDQLAAALHLPPDGPAALAAGDLGRYYARPRRDVELSVANALWGQAGLPWRPEFRAALADRSGAGFREADFAADPDAERERINRWAEEATRGRVKELLRDGAVTGSHRLVLANAVYFKGAWQKPFDPNRTVLDGFTLPDGTTTLVPMMRRASGFRWHVEEGPAGHRDPGFQLAELPYEGGELSMVVLLPGQHDGLPALEARLSADALAGWLAAARDAGDADLYLPRFRLEPDALMLTEQLRQLGVVAAFDPAAADFGGLHAGGGRLFVGCVVQKAFVDVSEEGTEAAAVTAVAVEPLSAAPPDFRADRPFLFLIRDARRGTILFMGRVQKP